MKVAHALRGKIPSYRKALSLQDSELWEQRSEDGRTVIKRGKVSERIFRNSNRLLYRTFYAVCYSANSPRSLALWLMFKYNEHEQLVNHELVAGDYHIPNPCITSKHPVWQKCPKDGVERFSNDYFCSEYLKKYKGLNLDVDTRRVALQKFISSEVACRISNMRIHATHYNAFVAKPRGYDAIISIASRKISSILGDFSFEAVWQQCGWGKGATTTLSGSSATIDNKVCEDQISVTSTCWKYFSNAVSDNYAFLSARGLDVSGPACLVESEFQILPGGRLDTVPKNAKTDRIIHIEPTANMFMQKGVGDHIRRRLLRCGVNLNDQRFNQLAAQRCYITGECTVDLSAASDTICIALVYELLPIEWASYLDDLRSKIYSVVLHPTGDPEKDKVERFLFNKWSSMGNGYTFELESLIFYALTKAVLEYNGSDERVLVYGDDIIMPSKYLTQLRNLFSFVGFTINEEKTHADENFFESCGKHYFNGCDVTPKYQKEVPETLHECYRLYNRLFIHDTIYFGREYCRTDRFAGALTAILQEFAKIKLVLHKVPIIVVDGSPINNDAGIFVENADFRQHANSRDNVIRYLGYAFTPKKRDLRVAYSLLSTTLHGRRPLNTYSLDRYLLLRQLHFAANTRVSEREVKLRFLASALTSLRLSDAEPLNSSVTLRRLGRSHTSYFNYYDGYVLPE